jgi:signal transduction histidine kinase
MSLKLRFALLFTLFVAVILLISSATIYILYFNYRRSDFYSRIKREGLSLYEKYKQDQVAPQLTVADLSPKYNTLVDQEWLVLDSTGKTLYIGSTHVSYVPTAPQLQQIKRDEEYRAQVNDRQYVGMYFPVAKEYVWISAFDIYGIKRLKNIKYILAIVFFGSLILTAAASFLFVKQAFLPLKKLSDQMRKTSNPDNAEKVQAQGTSNDEIQQIAISYNDMIDRLKKSFDLQRNFVHHASHELRTPLASMLSQTEAALNKDGDVTQLRNTLKSLKEDQEDMIELTNSLLLLSQYEKLRFSEEWGLLRVDEVLYDAMNALKKIYPDAKLTLSFKTEPETADDMLIKGNESLLRSAFFNLLKNGYAYSADKAVGVVLENCRGHLEIYFENKGQHLTPAEQQRMFMPFFRGENAMQKKGNGLGLTIIKRIIDVHHGNINYSTIEPDINKFTIVLSKAGV